MSKSDQSTVLVVDDNESARYAKMRLLTASGFRVVDAATGLDALRISQEQKPDVVLLDIRLPDIDGFEVCRRLRADPDTSSVTIIQITASLQRPAQQVRGLNEGADMFLIAPIDPNVLAATVRAMIRLRRAENALRQADRRKDEFLAVLAHELRNPLAPLRYGLQIFQQAELIDPALRNARQIMERQVSQMVRLIDDLLEVSRINQNKLELRRAATTVEQVIDQAVETCRPGVEAAEHQLQVSLPDEPLRLYADRVRLAQVFGNLISNSTKYMEPGGTIRISARREGEQAVILVTDNGVGIAPDELSRVFEMFAQSRRETANQSGGLGIGLALVRRLVELHGGSVSAESPGVGRGSTFTVRLPLTKGAAGEAAHENGSSATAGGSSRKVLVVDDNRDSADSLCMILETLGHDVQVAYDGLEAVRVAETFRPEAILMDVSMPHLNGLEAAGQIRGQDWGRDILICALTGYGQKEDRRRSEEAGINHHLVKPVDPDLLIQLLAS